MSDVYEINDPDELAEVRWQWNQLARETPGATFFHTVDWFSTYWKHFGRDARMRVVVVRDGADLGHHAVGRAHAAESAGRGPSARLPLRQLGKLLRSDRPRDDEHAGRGHGLSRRARRDWELLELAAVDTHGSDQGRTARAMAQEGFARLVEPWQTSALIDLAAAGDWDQYWGSRTSRWRNNVRRAEKQLAARGPVAHLRYRPAGLAAQDGDPRWDLYDDCERIAAQSWQGGSQSGTTLSHESIRPFLRDCHAAAARAGALDLNLLLVGGQAVAFNYAYQFAGSVYGLRTGYNSEAAREGAGTVLQRLMIEDSFGRGDHTYDLGPDYLECKRYWATETRSSDRCTHFAAEPIAQLARLKRGIGRWWAGARGISHEGAKAG